MVQEDPRGRVTQLKSGLGYVLAIVALLLFVSEVFVVVPSLTPEVQWNKVYDGTESPWAWSAQQTSDGGFVLAGEGNRSYAWLLKTDSGGNVQWNRTFEGSGSYYAGSVQQTSDGGYVFGGGKSTSAFWLVKLDQDGNMEWNKTYGNVEAGFGYFLRQTFDGGYIVAAYGYSGSPIWRYIWLAKTDSNGNVQWNRTYGNIEYFKVGPYLLQTSDGGYMIVTMTPWNGENKGDALLVKLDKNGDLQWNKTYGGSNIDYALSALQTADGGYVFAGGTWSSGAGLNDVWLVKVDGNGTMQWSKTYGGQGNDEAYLIQKTSDGGYILVGGYSGDWLMKTDSYGNLQWKKALRDPSGRYYDCRPVFAEQTVDGGYMVAGCVYGANFEGGFWLMKLAAYPSSAAIVVFLASTVGVILSAVASVVLIEGKRRTK